MTSTEQDNQNVLPVVNTPPEQQATSDVRSSHRGEGLRRGTQRRRVGSAVQLMPGLSEPWAEHPRPSWNQY
eukprot:1134535-Pelagomonas_calceolata.AAC.2